MAASMGMASDMAATDFFRDTGVDSSSPAERVSTEGFMFTTLLEDVAAGYKDARSAVHALLQDAAHRENILGNYAFVGAGYAHRRFHGYQHYWALYFANAIDEECDDPTSHEA
ncbi:hypothetical protein PINS_up000641 [Pythium insidiosum]|nr:hypothetical protein PINS_up000641 [Pythium insidiosum]